MRLSVDKSDPGYHPLTFGVKVYLCGVPAKFVVTADEEKGMCVMHVLNEHGQPQLNRERTEVLTETVYGSVRIEIPEGHPLACPTPQGEVAGRDSDN
ncbi:MAG: hypothetical protein EPO09_09145 [Aquabacterium sp.]|uniref:hypothetical protein n=1 Tax=Aquabacterium sp. TaxID=1872578 RepID=UPI0011FD7A82|nr:hypothetical protein [Aquabacterium sp.]TAK94682.1 MAG: hypothetical protein EPO09_09145 [Aquabacterium sp.]